MEKIFFQSSLPRSGSTMFQNIMGQNPDFYVTPTSGVLDMLWSARQTFNGLPEIKAQDQDVVRKGLVGFCRGALEGYFQPITDKKYILDKSRGWGVYRDFTNLFYPDPKIICFVRNLKDIVSSFEKIHRENKPYFDKLRDEQTASGTTIHKRVDDWMNPMNPIGRAIERLFEIFRMGYSDKILFIKYEDFCLYPEVNMKRVYDYLEIQPFIHNFDQIEQITIEDDEAFGIGRDIHKIRAKLEIRHSDAHRVLGSDICDWLFNNYKWFYDQFGYSK